MSLDAAAFLVNRAGTNYFCQGQDLADRMQVGDKVLVQRNGQRFYTWYGKSADTPYLTRRIEFNNQCYPDNNGGTSAHTDQPGEANLSYWYNCGGPSPLKEWRNIRNKNAGSFVDLDGEDFKLLDQSLISEGSICRITSDAGWRSWHEIEFKGGNDQIGFKPQYTNDDGSRDRTDLKVEGVTNNYKPANGEILTLDFLDPEAASAFSDIEDDDLLLAWDGSNNRKVTGANFKTLFSTTTSTLEDAQECHRECYQEYQRCKLLCETAYCRSICDAQYEECVAECYESRGFTVPLIINPPPRA